MVKSADRAMDILDTLAEAPLGLTHAELAGRLAIPRSSLTGLLDALTARDFVEYDSRTKRYLTGFAVLRLGRSYLARLDLVQCARPLIASLSTEIEEACALTVRRDHTIVVVAKMDDPHLYRPSLSQQLGASGPLHASASGKAMLAAAGEAAVADYLARIDAVPRDPTRPLDAAALRADLRTALDTGFGWSRGEMFEGIVAVGVAIRGSTDDVVAGLSVSLPHERATPEHLERIKRALRDTADALSIRMGAAA